ncbi:beta-eliminating lyase [Neofusicoccum parvum]|uniref:Beta-eliminating lyase n=1 Tax=Neofusicoccum parvum TaxID=310453 RepID=A0ACB5SQM7_9PEZI|nr:beta-eliminating lyase [Neofusicoccum parvum]
MDANGATVTTERGKDGVSGDWEGTGISFRSEDGMNRYIVSVDSPELGITGEMILNTVAPSHYPCTSNIANADTEMIPTIGWANAIPDSNASAHFTIRDEATNSTQVIEFSEGIGYHDKNWGSTAFSEATSGWEWGHGRVGPYSVVWFDAVDWDNTEYVSGYVAKDGEILSAGCHASSLKARPEVSNGAEGDFPPLAISTIPTGFILEFEMEDGNVLAVKTSNDVPLAGTGSYRRWLGSLTGSLGGDSETFEGHGLWEMFNIPLLLEGSSGN